MLERESDPSDRRRTLVWLTPAGHETLRRDRAVLGPGLVAAAMDRLSPSQASALIAGLEALIDQAACRPPQRAQGCAPKEET